MAQLKVKFRGNPVSDEQIKNVEDFETVQIYEVQRSTRGDVNLIEPITLEEDQIIQLDFTDDTTWVGDMATLEQLFPQSITRSGDSGELFLDSLEIDSDDRNAVKRIGVKLFSLFKKKKSAIQNVVKDAAIRVENSQLSIDGVFDFKSIGAGVLAHCEVDFSLIKLNDKAVGKRALLFLHGTGSSTSGSFASLYQVKEKINASWPGIYKNYGTGNVLAFQHRTLTCSPLENVLELVTQLPSDIELDVVTHSRGGLVGDVLARFATDSAGFDKTERGVLANSERTKDLEMIDAIQQIMISKKIKVSNMVRVACPANGTTLASQRLDLILNVFLNLIGTMVGSATNPAFQAFRNLVMTAVDSKDNTEVLPGLEAMNPDSPFIKVLNFPGSEIKVDSQLHVVGGSCELSLSFQGLIALVGKLFFRGKNDLVVDTESMKWGAPRREGNTFIFIDESKKINHIVYFSTEKTQEKVFEGLQKKDTSEKLGYLPLRLTKPVDQDRGILGLEGGRTIREKVSGKRPIVILMPGIMGSNLTVSEDMIWINYFRFISGQLTRLKNDPKNNLHVKAHSLVRTSYGKLSDYLGKSYDVVTFPFDWRMSLLDSAKILNDRLQELMLHGQPIKVVAHSMGGVLFRDFILHYPDTWMRLNSGVGFRAVFLGSPLLGSYRIPYVLFGQDDIIKLLGKIDISNSLKDLLGVFSQLPGLLNLLPIQVSDNDPDFSKSETWEKMRLAFGDPNWPIPSQQLLDQFGAYQAKVKAGAALIDHTNMFYIAGQSRKDKCTINSFEITDGNKLEFFGTQEGDESVTWATGIPSAIHGLKQVYYANVTHGALSTEVSIFGSIEEILSRGKASALANQLPKLRGEGTQKFKPKTEEIFDLSEANVENVLLGISAQKEEDFNPPIRVSVAHGDLKFAKFPVLAGHFELDTIMAAEREIDRQMGGELSKLMELSLYPGPIGTNQIVLSDSSKSNKFKGAVIVGLGAPGQLTAFQLTNSVEMGISRYLTILNRKEGDKNSTLEPIGISVIAIANSYGGLSSDTSIRAILTGIIQSNQKVRNAYQGRLRQIEEVEVIELFQDRALSILKTVNRLRGNPDFQNSIIFETPSLTLKHGRKVRIPFETVSDWWSRISVFQEKKEKGESMRVKMALATTGASQKVEFLKINVRNLDSLLMEMTELNQASPEIAKTLFELLVPIDFKDELKRQPNISWVVDEVTSAFPWEMLREDLKGNPLSINSGMVRQMATESYRKGPATVHDYRALVIGDPVLHGFMPQLGQAAREAFSVADKLQDQGFEVKSRINSSTSGILLDFFSNSYKVIHVAAHGVFDPDDQERTGIVIGKDAILTVQEIAQMSTVPELVFVNCCYLGKSEKDAGQSSEQRNKLAANIGTQLIRNGVKAVVVAGWAVDDRAALEFAESFYEEMFAGYKFGVAVLRARKRIFEHFGQYTNTWGAYQCYGDPFYHLSAGNAYGNEESEFLVKEEVEIEMENLVQLLDAKSLDESSAKERLGALESNLKKSGIHSEKITEGFAVLYSKVGEYNLAMPYFEKLFKLEKADFSLRAMEQWCNIRCKHAVEIFHLSAKKEKDRKLALAEIDDAIVKLQSLIAFGGTSERYSLLGSAYKRKLMVLSKDAQKEIENLLGLAAGAYQEAFSIKEKNDYYSLINWAQLLKLKSLFADSGRLKEKKQLFEYLESNEESLSANLGKEGNIWDRFGIANIKLARLVLEEGNQTAAEVAKAFSEVLEKVGASGHLKAQIEHYDILIKCLEASQKPKAQSLVSKIKAIKTNLSE